MNVLFRGFLWLKYVEEDGYVSKAPGLLSCSAPVFFSSQYQKRILDASCYSEQLKYLLLLVSKIISK